VLDSLKGTVLELDQDHAVVDVNGLRFGLEIPASTAAQLARGAVAEVRTRLNFNANDGAFALYGFATAVERDCFDTLCTISGIGPRKALAILSQIEIAAFAGAIVQRDETYIAKIKGVGKKTAERLIVELREKMVPFVGTDGPAPAVPALSAKQNVKDALDAMMALGCRPAVAEKAIRIAVELLGEDARTEELIREGLKNR
jgi:Holliday junction DNA helicase RuvA